MYYLCSENKGADRLWSYRTADLGLCFHIMQKYGFLMTRLIYYTGQIVEGNLLGVYGQGEFIGVAGLMVGYGIWADGMQAAQADRGSGRLRYLSK